MAGKKKKKKKIIPFRQENRITYNAERPNRKARRLGAVAEVREGPGRVPVAAVLNRKVQETRKMERKIVPPGMTYGEYIKYLKEKRQQLEEKKAHLQ